MTRAGHRPSRERDVTIRYSRTNAWAYLTLIAFLAGPVLAGCGVSEFAHQRLLVWHDWPEPEAGVLTELLTGYEDLDPNLDLIVEYVPADEIESRFADEVKSGFGPDVLIGVDAGRLAELTQADAVRPISDEQIELHGLDQLDSRAMGAMAVDETQRGIPLAGFTDVLYFREGVAPPRSLEQIVDLAEDGRTTAIPLDFFRAYWGVDAFGGSVFASGGEVAPDDGFVEWMEWLVEARPHPNVILDGEYEMLRDLFAAGEIDVFIGGSRELGTFRTVLQESDPGASPDGDETATGDGGAGSTVAIDASTPTLTDVEDLSFGLTTLPMGENEEAGGFLDVEGMVVNRHTDSFGGALDLMEYLTNAPSQGRIARSGVARIPNNGAVSIDPTISPIEAALVAQQRRAVLLPADAQHHRAELRSVANDVYLQVTRGLLEPAAAVDALADGYDEATEVDGG
jgi:ABC-type glycerol-3-phosphate transport system substrate-binding protein